MTARCVCCHNCDVTREGLIRVENQFSKQNSHSFRNDIEQNLVSMKSVELDIQKIVKNHRLLSKSLV